MPIDTQSFKLGDRIRITQQTPRMRGTWTNTVEGVITRLEQSKTGSWYAHSKDHTLWLDRMEIRMDDGELAILNLDQYSHVKQVD